MPAPDPRSRAQALYSRYERLSDPPELERWLANQPEVRQEPELQDAVLRLRRSERRGDASRSRHSSGCFYRAEAVRARPAQRPADPRPGMSLGDFVLIRFIAQGGMGQVWEAEQRGLKRRVALKLVRPERIDTRSLEFFAREARAGGRLHHPNIVETHAFGTTDGQSWIAQELVEGSWTLKHFLDEVREEEELPIDYFTSVAELIAKVADALEASHRAGVIHRDVKPQNVLITPDDEPKLTDFGLARIIDESDLSRTGDFVGTLAYMSPEQVAARRAGIDHRTDVFSLGVVLYECLALRRPFEGDSTRAIAEQILTVEPRPLRAFRKSVPRDMDHVCRKALAKARESRYQHMSEFAEDLRRFLSGDRVRPPSRIHRLQGRTRRFRVALGVAIAAISLLLFLWPRPTAHGAEVFSGAGYRDLLVAGSDADERSPTFVGERFLLFERRETVGGLPGIWFVDLESGMTDSHRLSPEGQAYGAPSVSPDGSWLACEVPLADDEAGRPRTAIELRPVRVHGAELVWTVSPHERLEPERGSFRGLRWSRSSLFVYTHDEGGTRTLVLRDPSGALEERKLGSFPGDDVRRRPFGSREEPLQVCFGPESDRVAVFDAHAMHTLRIQPAGARWEVQSLDCGTYRSPTWLDRDRILVLRQGVGSASSRLHVLANGTLTPLARPTTTLLGSHADLAVSSDGTMLAVATDTVTTRTFLCTSQAPAPVELATRFPAVDVAWSPDGELVYSAEHPAGESALFVHDLERGIDERLELEIDGLDPGLDSMQMDQIAFSEGGSHLVFRIRGEPLNLACDASEWIVIGPWPPSGRRAIAYPAQGRRVAFPHVSDDGTHVVWFEPDARQIVTARAIAGRLEDVRARPSEGVWPVRVSGDGSSMVVPWPDFTARITDWDGNPLGELRDAGLCVLPTWIPSLASPGASDLAYLLVDPDRPDELTVRSRPNGGAGEMRTLSRLPAPPADPLHSAFDQRGERAAHTIQRVGDADLWLTWPNRERN